MPLARGTRLGPYEVLAPIGAGGMGEVWRARDTKLARDVALKVLPDHLSDDPKALARFESEAKAVAALSHPHILAIFDFGRAEGVSYVVTELLEGETLRALLARGPLATRKALDVAAQLADALAAAHEKEIVHRDMKPENVIVAKEGRAKLLDFGLARHDPAFRSGDDSRSPTVTRHTDPGAIVGTVSYMSPEQAQGLPVGFRSDQFSLGVVLYEMLTGRRPFHGPSSAETLTAIIRAEHEPLAGAVPAPVRWIVDRLLAKDPAERYAATRDVARDLETCRLHLSEATTGPSGAKGTATGSRRGAWIATGALALAAVVVGAYRFGSVRGGAMRTPGAVPRLERLTWEGGVENQPTISPDGGSFAYIAGAFGKNDIFLRRVGGESAINLTKGYAGDDLGPAFSPDGRSIAFRSERDGGGIFVMGATGESPRRLTDFGWSPRWSPDGTEIAFATQPGQGVSVRSEIWIAEVATGARRRVYDGNGVSPAWSPDGKRLAFHQRPGFAAAGKSHTLSTIPVAGGPPEVVLEIPSDLGSLPFWSREGIFFVSQAGGAANVWRVRVDERTGKRIGDVEPVLTSEYSTSPSATPDGRRVVSALLRRSFVIERRTLDALKEDALGEPRKVFSGSREMRLAAVSPDGEWLATIAWDDDGRKDILLIRADTGETRRLTEDHDSEDFLVWAPDSSRLYFGLSSGGEHETWSIRPDGSGRELVLPRAGADLVVPAWASPDGGTLYVNVGKEMRLHALDLSMPRERRSPVALPMPEPGRGFVPGCGSPDGGWLVGYPTGVAAGVPRTLLLYDVRDRAFSKIVELTEDYPCAVLPDARNILLYRSGQVDVLDRVTRRFRQVGSLSASTVDVGIPADGRSLFSVSFSIEGDIWMLDYGKKH